MPRWEGTIDTGRPVYDPLEDGHIVPQRKGNIYDQVGGNFVSKGTQPTQPPKLDVLPPHIVQMDVQHPVVGQVVKHTSEVDGAWGFAIRTGVLALVVSLFAVVAVGYLADEFLTFVSLVVFLGVFAFVFLSGWVLDTLKAPEFTALVQAVCQCFVIILEQKERWAHYKWQAGRTLPVRPWWVEYKGWIVLGGVVWSVFFAVVIASIVWG